MHAARQSSMVLVTRDYNNLSGLIFWERLMFVYFDFKNMEKWWWFIFFLSDLIYISNSHSRALDSRTVVLTEKYGLIFYFFKINFFLFFKNHFNMLIFLKKIILNKKYFQK